MRNMILILLLIALIPVIAFGQDSGNEDKNSSKEVPRIPIPPFERKEMVQVDWQKIERRIEVNVHAFNVVCDLITPPQPLTPARAVITLTSVSETEANRGHDMEFYITYPTPQVELLNEVNLIWSAPRNTGDIYTIEVEFLTHESGFHFLELGMARVETRTLHVEWFLDDTGELRYLRSVDKRYGAVSPYHAVKTVFFDPDSVNISRDCRPNPRQLQFNTRMTITPPLQIGDTSTISYYLTAHDPIPGGIHYNFEALHMDVVSLPDRLVDYSIGAGETVVLEIKAVPHAVRDPHFIKFKYSVESVYGPGHPAKSISCWSVFNEDGSLRFVYPLPWKNLEDSHYPQSFPESTDDGRWKSRWFRDTHQPSPRDLEGLRLERREKK